MKVVRHLDLILVLSLTSSLSWSQIKLDSMLCHFRNIPVLKETTSTHDTSVTFAIQDFIYSVRGWSSNWTTSDSMLVRFERNFDKEEISFSWRVSYIVSFTLDTEYNRLSDFIIDHVDIMDSYRAQERSEKKRISFRSIPIKHDANQYRAFMFGNDLREQLFNLKDGLYFQYHAVEGSSSVTYTSLPDSISDSSSVELLFYGTIPLEVSHLISDKAFAVFPNPATNSVTISNKALDQDLELYDILGRKRGFPITDKEESQMVINISGLLPGTYYLRCGKLVQKLLVAR